MSPEKLSKGNNFTLQNDSTMIDSNHNVINAVNSQTDGIDYKTTNPGK